MKNGTKVKIPNSTTIGEIKGVEHAYDSSDLLYRVVFYDRGVEHLAGYFPAEELEEA
jgi:hypothetical protein